MTTRDEKTAKRVDEDEDLYLPLTPEQIAELERQRQAAIARDAARVRAYRDRVRGVPAPMEIAGD